MIDNLAWIVLGKMQRLFELLQRGEQSQIEALYVGALIEEVDIEDLLNAIAETNNPDLKTIYNNLLRGSRNHLRAYVGAIERQAAVSYEAEILEQAVVDEIVNSPMERGGRRGGAGRGGPGGRR